MIHNAIRANDGHGVQIRMRKVLVSHIMEEEGEDQEDEKDDRREDRQQRVEERIAESQNNHIMSI